MAWGSAALLVSLLACSGSHSPLVEGGDRRALLSKARNGSVPVEETQESGRDAPPLDRDSTRLFSPSMEGDASSQSTEVASVDRLTASDGDRSVVRVSEAAPDREGTPPPPSYIELVAASSAATTDTLRLTLRFSSPLPDSMADDDSTFMSGFNVWAGEREFALSATLDDEGWVAAFEERGAEELEGRFRRARDSIVFEMRRDLLGEVRDLRWVAGAVLTEIDPAPLIRGHDLVPNDGAVRHRLR